MKLEICSYLIFKKNETVESFETYYEKTVWGIEPT